MTTFSESRAWVGMVLVAACCLAPRPAARAEDVTSPRPQWRNLAAGKSVQFSPAPNYPEVTDPADALQMVDGKFASAIPMWYDRSAVGWVQAEPCAFTIDLGENQPIRGVALHIPGGQAGVEWPASVQVSVSETGARYTPVGDLMELSVVRPPAKGYAAIWLLADALETHGRFVRFVCTPVNLGNGSYIFLDEVEVYQGDPAWLARPLVAAAAPTQWRATWQDITWTDNTSTTAVAERPERLLRVDGALVTGAETPLQQAVAEPGGMCFRLSGEAGRPRSMSWTGKLAKPVSTAVCRYALLTFQAEGIRRTYEPRPLVLLQGVSEKTADSQVILLEVNAALNDGRSHTLVKPLPEGFTLQQLQVFLITEDDAPRLLLERLELLSEVPAIFAADIVTAGAAAREGFTPVPLGAALTGTLADWYEHELASHQTVLDGVRSLPAGPVTVAGVPFTIAAGEKNLALMPESQESKELVDFLGGKVEKRYLGPVSRDDSLSVDVSASAREAFLLLALSAPPVQKRGGLPYTALRLDDIECIAIELSYDQGASEIAFPYSLADQGCYVPAREVGAYAVAVDPTRRLQRLTLHNHQFGPNFALAALTLNTSAAPLLPALAELPAPEVTAAPPEPPAQPLAVSREGQRLTFANRWYEASFDLAQGFVLDRLVHRASPATPIRLAPSCGLRLRVGNTVYTGRSFSAGVTRLGAAEAELQLKSSRAELPLEITVKISADESPELTFVATTQNRGEAPLAAELCLPALAGLTLGEPARTRLFFPQYRVVDTAETIALRAPYGPEFIGQFMDVYNRQAGIGLMLRSNNLEQRMATYALRKEADGVSGGVCFPADYNELAPGARRDYPAISLLAHRGDWRAAFDLYRNWVRSWYAPHKAQDKDYLLNAWDIACYRPSVDISWSDTHTPPPITADRKRFLWAETFEFEKQYLGHVPDMVHFFNWTHNDEKKRNEYGVHGTPLAYAQVGGLEFFRQGIAELQTTWKRPLSLYALADRFRASALPDQELAKELIAVSLYKEMDSDVSAALRGAGAVDGIIYPPIGHERFIDFIVSDVARMQRDTGCKMVYIDVFPYFSHLRGHKGISPREADLMVVRKLREALPADVALWSEYSLTDVGSQYADGSLQYYFLDLNQVFARCYNRSDRADDLCTEMPLGLGRYLLPRYKIIDLAGYIEAGNKPSQIDAVFVNGEAFQEDTWRLHHSRLREKLNRAYVLKHEYNDCFTEPDPTPRVDTAAAGLVANRFSGRNRTLWTLYNGRPKTYAGVVLTVPHRDGARYRDVWNGQELSPAIEQGMARISLTLHPQQPGCVVQELRQP